MTSATPEGWKRVSLGDLGRFTTSSVDKLIQPGERPVQLLNYMDVYRHRRIDRSIKLMQVTASEAEVARYQVQVGDILFTPSSETSDDIGHSAVVADELPGTVHSYHTVRLRPDSRFDLDLEFRGWMANNENVLRYFANSAAGSTRYTLGLGRFASATLDLPPISEQRCIAKILSTLDEAITQTEALIAKHQQINAGLMHDLFTRGVTPDGHLRPTREQAPDLYKESTLGWIPKEWVVCKLGEVADINRGKFTIRPRNDPRFYGGEYPFIQTGDVSLANGRVLTTYSQTLNNAGLAVSRLFDAGTIMVTIAANIADTCVLGVPMCAPDSLVGVRPNTKHVSRFIELCIRRRKNWLEARAPQTAQKNINLEDLRPLLIPAPRRSEQKTIAAIYESIDASLTASQHEVEKLRQQKQGLMHDLLTGHVRVNDTERGD